MKSYTVKAYMVTGLKNNVFRNGDVVFENQFTKEAISSYVKSGSIEPIVEKKKEVKTTTKSKPTKSEKGE